VCFLAICWRLTFPEEEEEEEENKKNLSILEVKTGESTEPFYWYTINKTRDTERQHTVQYDRSEFLNILQNTLILTC